MKKVALAFIIVLVAGIVYEMIQNNRFRKQFELVEMVSLSEPQNLDSTFNVYSSITSRYIATLPAVPSEYFSDHLKVNVPIFPSYYRFWDFYNTPNGQEQLEIIVSAERTDKRVMYRFERYEDSWILSEIEIAR